MKDTIYRHLSSIYIPLNRKSRARPPYSTHAPQSPLLSAPCDVAFVGRIDDDVRNALKSIDGSMEGYLKRFNGWLPYTTIEANQNAGKAEDWSDSCLMIERIRLLGN